ncbi:MAG: DUF4091 domain-containing protein [Lentisphaerae bacterium]|nr:DUF4091 domain-containing protein [Lentisphaerota bacterium]
MKKYISLFCAVFLGFQLFAEVKIVDHNGNISAGNGRLSMYLLAKRNFAFNLSGKDKDGKNFGAVIETIIWYHGRSGNMQHIYEDQSEAAWKLRDFRIDGNVIRSFTGNADFDVMREIEFFDDTDAIRYEYVVSSKESREFTRFRFPLTRLTKEITSVSYDDGTLEKFTTSAAPKQKELTRTRAFLFHMPERGKTLLMLMDLNTPLKYGHNLGLMPTYSPGSWARSVNFHHLYMPAFPFYKAGDKLGIRLYFQLLDGGSLTEDQQFKARELAEKMQVKPCGYPPSLLDGEYRKPSAFAALLNSVDGVKIWSESPLKRVYPAMDVPEKKASAVKLISAANERESIQLVFNPGENRSLEKVVFSDLVSAEGKKIAADNFYANVIGFQTIAAPLALYYGETRFADKLRPVADALPAKLKAGQNSILHLTFYAPPGTPKGTYKGNVALTVSGKETRIPVELRVWGFELPAKSKFTTYGLLWSSLPEHRDELLRELAKYGISGSVYYGGQKQLREIFDGNELRFKDDLALAVKALNEYNISVFQAPYLFMGAWNWKPGKKVQFLNLDLDTPEFDRNFTNYLKSFHRQAKEKGILDRTIIYMWDEMTGGHYDAMVKTTSMVHKYAPGIRLMTVSAPDPMVLKYNDIITTGPLGQWMGKDARKVVEKALADGKEFWIYLNGMTFATDVETTIPRVTPWQCYANGFTGYLQWSMDYNWQYGSFEKNGDVWILHPGYDKPVYSARLEYYRDGVEDFNMMCMMKDLPAEVRAELEAEIAKVAPLMGKMNPDPEQMYEIRCKIGDALERYKGK